MRWLGGVVAVTVLVATLTGCGGGDDNPWGLSTFSPGAPGAPVAGTAPSSTAASATPTGTIPTPAPAPSGAVTYKPADAFGQGAWVERGRIDASSADQQAVVDAVVAYFRARVQISNTWQVDDARLTAVSAGKALATARERAVTQETLGRRSIGKFVLNLSSVTVDGDRAVVQGCPFDGTSEVDADGRVIDYPPGGIRYRLDLEQTGGHWLVTTYPTRSVVCEAP